MTLREYYAWIARHLEELGDCELREVDFVGQGMNVERLECILNDEDDTVSIH